MSIAGVVLAAGGSQRLGRPKQTVEIGGETLLHRTVRIAREAGLRPVFVVLDGEGRFAGEVRGLGGSLVLNQEADEGIAASIRAGVRAAKGMPGVDGAVLMTCDQIGITAEHLCDLYEDRDRVTGSGYGGRTAIPAYFPRSAFESLLKLQGDYGAREALRGAHRVDSEALAVDVDTPEDIVRASQLFGTAR